MQMQILSCLLELAARGADKDFVRISSGELGIALGKSQQTASRLMVTMEREGLLLRRKDGRNQTVRLASAGLDELRGLHQSLSRIFDGYVIEGKVFTGVGEGAYYMRQEGYRKQFKKKLGFDPYPGTLNLRVATCMVEELAVRAGTRIEGFQTGNRSFGGGRCYEVRISPDAPAAVFLPDRTHYPDDVLEVVSPEHLRTRLGLRDGDIVCLTVLPSQS